MTDACLSITDDQFKYSIYIFNINSKVDLSLVLFLWKLDIS